MVSAASENGHALEELCMTYWPALYKHVRRMGYDDADAQDLTQSFFARLLEKQILARADRTRGRFRSFLLTSLHRFVINEWHRGEAAKRGGDREHFSIDFSQAAEIGIGKQSTPEAEFQREWAMCVIERSFERLREEHIASGKQELFDAIACCIVRDADSPSFSAVAEKLKSTIAAVKMAASRTRKRLRELVLDEVRATVMNEEDVEDELTALFCSLSRRES